MVKNFSPNLHTPEEQFSREEINKNNSNGLRGDLKEELKDFSKCDISWESEQLAKSYGIYLAFDRAKSGSEKDWMYMLRVTVPGGGPLDGSTWSVLNEISESFTTRPEGMSSSLRLTTRQNVQFHWIKKSNLVSAVRKLAQSGLKTLNGCGDNTRNVMACPLSAYSTIFDANSWAKRIADYFELPADPFLEIFEIDTSYLRSADDTNKSKTEGFSYGKSLLNRKFKIGISAVQRDEDSGKLVADNCVEVLTNDLAIVPVFDQEEQLTGFQISLGGGQGERNGKPGMSVLAQPFAFVTESELLATLAAVVKVHQLWGDRQNRHWGRLKYVIKKMGIPWYREQVQQIVSFELRQPLPEHDPGQRNLHHGWSLQANGNYTYGVFIENGRITDSSSNGLLKSAISQLLQQYPIRIVFTPNQDLLFTEIPAQCKDKFLNDLQSFGYGSRCGKSYSQLRLRSGACVGRDTCRLAYTDSEKFEPELLDKLEEMGWGHIATSIGITGCERQCFRPATKAIGLVGSGLNLYQLKLLGTEDARHQGQALLSEDAQHVYLRSIPRERVAAVIDSLFKLYIEKRLPNEELGYCFRRIGLPSIIGYLQECKQTSDLMLKTQQSSDILNAPIGPIAV